MSDTRGFDARYQDAYGLPSGRPTEVRRNNFEQDYEYVKTLDGGDGPQIGGLNEGVFLVRRKRDRRQCVQKRLKRDNPVLRREIYLLHHLSHPRIIEYIDAFIMERSPRACSLFMDYCDAGSLEDVIENYTNHNQRLRDQRKMPEGFLWHVLEQMASALQYLHHGLKPYDPCPIPYPSDPSRDDNVTHELSKKWPVIVHRDIKPANILLKTGQLFKEVSKRPRRRTLGLTSAEEKHYYRSFPNIVLADFGLAYMKTDADFNRLGVIGTPNWFPPEIPSHSALGDIWQLGGLLSALARLVDKGPVPDPPRGWNRDSIQWYFSKASRRATGMPRLSPPYSEDLQVMVHMCLASEQKARPYAFRLARMAEEGKSRAKAVGLLDERQTLPRWASK